MFNKENNIRRSEIIKYDGNEFEIIATGNQPYTFTRTNGLPGDVLAALPNDKVLIKRTVTQEDVKNNDSNDCIIIDIYDNTLEKTRYEYIYPAHNNKAINNVYVEPDNKIWFGYQLKYFSKLQQYCCSGMSMWDFSGNQWTHFSEENGLPYNEYTETYLSMDAIIEYDEDRYLMCGGNKFFTMGSDYYLKELDGVDLFNHSTVYKCTQSLSDEKTNQFLEVFFKPDIDYGPSTRFFYAQQDTEGNVWFMTQKALVKVNAGFLGTASKSDAEKILSLHPNPATDIINISSDMGYNDRVEIYTLEGVCVHSGRGRRIDVSHLAPGVYFVRVGAESLRFVKM
jgi:hypothetical protein